MWTKHHWTGLKSSDLNYCFCVSKKNHTNVKFRKCSGRLLVLQLYSFHTKENVKSHCIPWNNRTKDNEEKEIPVGVRRISHWGSQTSTSLPFPLSPPSSILSFPLLSCSPLIFLLVQLGDWEALLSYLPALGAKCICVHFEVKHILRENTQIHISQQRNCKAKRQL